MSDWLARAKAIGLRTSSGKQTCPQCSHTRRNKLERCLSVTLTTDAHGKIELDLAPGTYRLTEDNELTLALKHLHHRIVAPPRAAAAKPCAG